MSKLLLHWFPPEQQIFLGEFVRKINKYTLPSNTSRQNKSDIRKKKNWSEEDQEIIKQRWKKIYRLIWYNWITIGWLEVCSYRLSSAKQKIEIIYKKWCAIVVCVQWRCEIRHFSINIHKVSCARIACIRCLYE